MCGLSCEYFECSKGAKGMTSKNISLLLYGFGFVFLVYDSYLSYLNLAYWELFKNAVFMGILAYMVFIYPKRKLYLNEDLMGILWIYFSAFTVKSFLEKSYLEMLVGIGYTLGYIAYKLYRRKRKYSFNLYKNSGNLKTNRMAFFILHLWRKK